MNVTPAEVAAMMRQRVTGLDNMLREATHEYTSKPRLRALAIGSLSTLREMYDAAAQQAEAAAQAAAEDSGLILPPEGIVVAAP